MTDNKFLSAVVNEEVSFEIDNEINLNTFNNPQETIDLWDKLIDSNNEAIEFSFYEDSEDLTNLINDYQDNEVSSFNVIAPTKILAEARAAVGKTSFSTTDRLMHTKAATVDTKENKNRVKPLNKPGDNPLIDEGIDDDIDNADTTLNAGIQMEEESQKEGNLGVKLSGNSINLNSSYGLNASTYGNINFQSGTFLQHSQVTSTTSEYTLNRSNLTSIQSDRVVENGRNRISQYINRLDVSTGNNESFASVNRRVGTQLTEDTNDNYINNTNKLHQTQSDTQYSGSKNHMVQATTELIRTRGKPSIDPEDTSNIGMLLPDKDISDMLSGQYLEVIGESGQVVKTVGDIDTSASGLVNTAGDIVSKVGKSKNIDIGDDILSYTEGVLHTVAKKGLSNITAGGVGLSVLGKFSFVGPIAKVFSAASNIREIATSVLSGIELPNHLPIPPLPPKPGGYSQEDLKDCIPEPYRKSQEDYESSEEQLTEDIITGFQKEDDLVSGEDDLIPSVEEINKGTRSKGTSNNTIEVNSLSAKPGHVNSPDLFNTNVGKDLSEKVDTSVAKILFSLGTYLDMWTEDYKFNNVPVATDIKPDDVTLNMADSLLATTKSSILEKSKKELREREYTLLDNNINKWLKDLFELQTPILINDIETLHQSISKKQAEIIKDVIDNQAINIGANIGFLGKVIDGISDVAGGVVDKATSSIQSFSSSSLLKGIATYATGVGAPYLTAGKLIAPLAKDLAPGLNNLIPIGNSAMKSILSGSFSINPILKSVKSNLVSNLDELIPSQINSGLSLINNPSIKQVISSVMANHIVSSEDDIDITTSIREVLAKEIPAIEDIDEIIRDIKPLIDKVKSGEGIDLITNNDLNKAIGLIVGQDNIPKIEGLIDNVSSLLGSFSAISSIPTLINMMRDYDVPMLTQINSIIGCLDLFDRAKDVVGIAKNPISYNPQVDFPTFDLSIQNNSINIETNIKSIYYSQGVETNSNITKTEGGYKSEIIDECGNKIEKFIPQKDVIRVETDNQDLQGTIDDDDSSNIAFKHIGDMIKDQLGTLSITTANGTVFTPISEANIDDISISTKEFSYKANEIMAIQVNGDTPFTWKPTIEPKDNSIPIEGGIKYKSKVQPVIGTMSKNDSSCSIEISKYIKSLDKDKLGELHIDLIDGGRLRRNINSINVTPKRLRLLGSIIKDLNLQEISSIKYYIQGELYSTWINR